MKIFCTYLLLIFSFGSANLLQAQWVRATDGYGGTVRCFAISGSQVFAGTDGGVFLSTDSGITWITRGSGLAHTTNIGLDTTVYALAASDSNLYAATGGGLFVSSNSGANWNLVDLANTGASGIGFHAIAVTGHNIIAGGEAGIVLRSMDDGKTWTELHMGWNGSIVYSIVIFGGYIIAGGDMGVYFFNPLDNSWTATSLVPHDIRSLATVANNLYAFSYTAGVFRSADIGASWKAVNTGMTNPQGITYDGGCFAVSDTNIFAGTLEGGVFLSTNSGVTWTAVNSGLTEMGILTLACSDSFLFAGTY